VKIVYTSDLGVLDHIELNGFFVGWPDPRSKEVFKRILRGSYYVVLVIDENKLVGFVNSISDGVLSAYIPLLEVLPNYQGKGIGKELITMLNKKLSEFYMVDLLCDSNLVPYY
jgi:ribosomal protein S18 acetylase RimI-like enzyme